MTATAPEAAALTRRYETLRAWATAQPRPAARPAGLALVLRLGLPGWLAAQAVWEPAAVSDAAASPAAAPTAQDGRLAAVLASMVERCRQEQEP